ncbi:MAG TPA: efflux RND transporter permease subunit [Candidatus Angelobacter sp.]|jgi:multidrug efflux pump subunit AcrB|nr:efflux RND transporter permease subunit [Candidatus Angelobacter sp.]
MWIVRLALRRPYTFVVLAILILILGTLSALRTPTDIFPNINIPVVSIIWNFTGMVPSDMASRIVVLQERNLTTVVNNIEHIESQSLNGIGVIKVFFHPGADISTAIAQIAGQSQTQLKVMPLGTTAPLVITYSASSVPILQLALSSPTLSEQQLNDYGLNFIRPPLTSVPGTAIPYPYGGKQRQVQVDLNTNALQANGLSPLDVVNAISAQNLILPTGTAKIGTYEYNVDMNGSPTTIKGLNDLPIKTVGTNTIYIRDVAFVRDGFPPQTNIVRVDGRRSTLMTIQKNGTASTLNIIAGIKQMLPIIKNTLPQDLQIKPLGDQSVFVRGAISGVVREALIAACLTAMMILLFLGSWRSTVIIAISIPLSILSSIIALSMLGETINLMTLGGLALAVGILVDDATVTIENIHRYLSEGKDIEEAILDGAQQIAIPALVSTLSICIVFVPMFLLTGVARYLFVPLAEAVVFAMLASYLLSRTLVPTLAKYFLKAHTGENEHEASSSKNPLVHFQLWFEHGFENIRSAYRGLLETLIEHRRIFVGGFLLACFLSFALYPWLGQDFFPSVDSGEFTLHMRAPTGTRIEETAALCDRVENEIRKQVPSQELTGIIDNIGLPYSGINLSYSNSAPVGTQDADIMVALSPKHHPTAGYVHDLRLKLGRAFPGTTFYFLPSDMVTQILNFGLPAPIDIQVVGNDLEANRQFADTLLARVKNVSGTSDLRIQQTFDQPKLHVDVDRTKAESIGFSQREVATNLLVTLSGSSQTSPTFWLNPKNGVSYSIATQTPQYRVQSLQDLNNIPITGAGTATGNAPPSILGSLASVNRASDLSVVSHYNVSPVIDIFGAVQGRDLGGVSKDLFSIINASKKELPRGSQVIVRGQIQTMRSSFTGLLTGLVFAIALVYLLIVMNFQSWLDPFIILMALPAALAGIVWFLFMTGTTISVPALTGSIMCVGVATANSILVVSFAKEQLSSGVNAAEAALQAGYMRFRPVLMTALAMIIGMAPMALGLGEGGEQNAPLGRAVIGGLLFATVSTLLFVPAVFSVIHGMRQATNTGKQQH